jgi:hypothetical protein
VLLIAPLAFAGCNQSEADSNSQAAPTVVVVSPPARLSRAPHDLWQDAGVSSAV